MHRLGALALLVCVVLLTIGCAGEEPGATEPAATAAATSAPTQTLRPPASPRPTATPTAAPTATPQVPVGEVTEIPAGMPPTVDGVLSPGEWDAAVVEPMSDGSELLLMHGDGYLYLGVRAATDEMVAANVFLETVGRVRIMHASAALGTANLEEAGDRWERTRAFDWTCRSTSSSDAAVAEREAYLAEEGWMAANSRMGTPNELEYRILAPDDPIVLAVSIMRTSSPDERHTWPVALDDDTTTPTSGGVPDEMLFQPGTWGKVKPLP